MVGLDILTTNRIVQRATVFILVHEYPWSHDWEKSHALPMLNSKWMKLAMT